MNDKTITVYNCRRNAEKKDSWIRTVIHGVEYSYKSEKTVSGTGSIVFTPILSVLVPIEADAGEKEYIDCIQYSKLSDDEAVKYFTFNPSGNKDMIVVGECEKEITGTYKISDLKADYQKCGVVSAFSDNTEGDLLKHYKAVCK